MGALVNATRRAHGWPDAIAASAAEEAALDARAPNLALLTTASTSAREEVWQTAQAFSRAASRGASGGDNALTGWANGGIAAARAACLRLFGPDDPMLLDLHGTRVRPL